MVYIRVHECTQGIALIIARPLISGSTVWKSRLPWHFGSLASRMIIWRFMGSYRWGYKSMNMGYNYS